MNDAWIPITLINQENCRFLSVTQETITKLKMIRPGVYRDDPRLRVVKDLPTPTPAPVYSPEAIAATERAVKLRQLMTNAKITTFPRVIEPEPKPRSFDEQIQHDWRFNPSIRKEFVSLASYAAYCRAVQAGRAKVCGRG